LRDTASGSSATIKVPRDYQLSALDANGTSIERLSLAGRVERRTFKLVVSCGQSSSSLDLVLLSPSLWSVITEREAPEPLSGPPPLPPRLG
jgi:hypothetical protein